MQKIQSAFNQLASQHRDEIMQLRRERNRAGLQELQDKLAAQAEAMVKGDAKTARADRPAEDIQMTITVIE